MFQVQEHECRLVALPFGNKMYLNTWAQNSQQKTQGPVIFNQIWLHLKAGLHLNGNRNCGWVVI